MAFANMDILPESILWRRKCAFSDGVSSQQRSWHQVLKNFIDEQISDFEFKMESIKINHCRPILKESYYYRKIFNSFFPDQSRLIPYYWMPKWVKTDDPSAREITGYIE
jgi:asparagine synthase (glutamine-hydrolysing)